MQCKLEDYKVEVLPLKGKPNSRYYVPNGNGTDIDEYVTDKDGRYRKVNPRPNSIPSSASVKSLVVLGEIIGSGFLVYISSGSVFKYDNTDLNLYDKPIGITNQAGLQNESVELITFGECSQMGGLVSGNQYYATTGGLISDVIPTTGIIQPVGVAISPTSLLVNMQKPYIRI